MGHIFRTGVTACDVGGSLVFLDLPRDRYFALGQDAREACLRLIDRVPPKPDDLAIIDRLIARDVLVRVDRDARPVLCLPAPRLRSSAHDGAIRVARGSVIVALGRYMFAIAELRIRPLAHILCDIARAKRDLRAYADRASDAAALAASFTAADRVMTVLDRCLPRSIALARSMIARGLAPKIILGVKLRPFEAHCWVQHGDCLVSDGLETIAPFTPVLVL
ncbi:MAG: lasso peptide biosynthesis B2 protein [Sphingomonadaceae bacterium]|nr:lasso peptide biosynthesis B2 protein [Sphingomonadaceae bacterium]